MRNWFLGAIILLISIASMANILELSRDSRVLEGVTLSASAGLGQGEHAKRLTAVGAGVRGVTRMLMNFNVYVAELFTSSPSQRAYEESSALQNIADTQEATAIHLQLLRNLSAAQIKEAFEGAMEKNFVDTNSVYIQEFLGNINAEVKEGQSIVIVAHWKTGVLDFEANGNANSIQGDKEFLREIFSIWLGDPVDNKMHLLKKSLLNIN